MLATEVTKTMYRDSTGRLHELRKEAEYDSVKEVINCAATKTGNVDLGVLVQELGAAPEAKQWLLEQLDIPLHETAINKQVWDAVEAYMREEGVEPKQGYIASQLQNLISHISRGHLHFVNGVIKHLSVSASPKEEAQAYTVPSVEQLQGILISLQAAHHPLTTDKAQYLHQLLSRLPVTAANEVPADSISDTEAGDLFRKHESPTCWQTFGSLRRAGYQLIKK